ncbi:MAG: polyphosphate kinase 2 family protein [Liquorilactobacillus nagelii]|uniref:polyphosphate kinase 2 family protein n=1 Tax=Liquorilactobacillus nagelii TaxID=82688 RepID=UPI001CCC053F|nr:polyphosphate kinase 2 family protein [Liquorilactobacillus nagelii]MCI1633043.1 polyphosphate kinase 2 family protein [Liquorilactobacillus nagelii]MCI1921248.1 polyphosphate kinase 2 family protein [Liquorilactobacillus nagelii]MCI1975873.1 polyphosphate kinase 2 family protein [Liquorilactobacillus nagelii]ULQ48853.1 polyphosphate kinase 2 family protein [Liquorilactobacillus nagelii]
MTFAKKFFYDGKKALDLNQNLTAVEDTPAKEVIKQQLVENIKKLAELQGKLYAQNRYGVLLVFQALDAAGKDSMIRHVMSGINPQGCEVTSFKQPSSLELDHDYLWRIHQHVPAKGNIGIFNRSYYEDVLVSRVHPELILNSHLAGITQLDQVDGQFFDKRFEDITYFENYLARNGILILKFFLHMSKEEQRLRFLRRIELPSHNWKFSEADIKERQYWDDYQQAYQIAISKTATKKNPWYLIPSDDKWYSRMCVSDIIVDRMKELPLHYPAMPEGKQAELKQALNFLKKEE